jgi:acyl-CoA synthetase (AMP-forming)/AMP-acid ligase II
MARFGGRLAQLGLKSGDTVGVLAEPGIDAIVAQFGILRAGMTVASLSTVVQRDALLRMIADCGAKALVVSPQHREAIAGDAIAPGRTIVLGEAEPAGLRGDGPAVAVNGDDPLCIIYSSGTTSLPKGIVLSHRCRLLTAFLTCSEFGYNSRSVVIVAAQLHSNTAWTLLIRAFLFGATAVVMGKFDAGRFCALVERHKATHTTLVPVQLQAILDVADGFDLTSIQTVSSTGSLMPPGLKRRLIERFPRQFYEVYGLTEGVATMLRPEDMAQHGDSAGRPVLGNDIRILGEDDRELPQGQRGEIVGYGPQLMLRYHNDEARTAQAIWREPRSGRTFLRTGDIGYFDAAGYLHVVDRKKDMIVSGGYNVFAADIEAMIATHPDIAEAGVIAVPHAKWGETPAAFVVPRPALRMTPEELRLWINQQLGKHQRVSALFYCASLPRNAGGKVVKPALRARYDQLAASGETTP